MRPAPQGERTFQVQFEASLRKEIKFRPHSYDLLGQEAVSRSVARTAEVPAAGESLERSVLTLFSPADNVLPYEEVGWFESPGHVGFTERFGHGRNAP